MRNTGSRNREQLFEIYRELLPSGANKCRWKEIQKEILEVVKENHKYHPYDTPWKIHAYDIVRMSSHITNIIDKTCNTYNENNLNEKTHSKTCKFNTEHNLCLQERCNKLYVYGIQSNINSI
ncbi:hypothetical protein PPRFG01_1235200 [Plasmodium sp. gorilla clade G1]|nr:hypothetical protein PPRFG01_1235200 [Plasmodium sp. gorilla clade G1]